MPDQPEDTEHDLEASKPPKGSSWNSCKSHALFDQKEESTQAYEMLPRAIGFSLGLLWLLVQSVVVISKEFSGSPNDRPPNFVVVLTDDLDWTLGGANASTLSRTRNLLLGDPSKGALLPNWFAHTPVCCPSRAQLLTGRFFHNLRTADPNRSNHCMFVDVQDNQSSRFYSDYFFAQHFQKLNYSVGVFGKLLNLRNPSKFVPEGIDTWLINGGGHYLNPRFTWSSKGSLPEEVSFHNCTQSTGMPCYSTSVIGNVSLTWLESHLRSEQDKPFFSYISVKAPHIQDGDGFPMSTPAPWYSKTFIPEQQAPRTPNYNQSCPKHHWLVRNQPPLTTLEGEMVDQLYASRLMTLLSVDDLMVALFELLKKYNVLEKTYIFFTSDNGYRLGQFQMPQCKLHAYENDIRVPMMIRGPALPPNLEGLVGTHVDLMPTLLGIATNDTSQRPVPSTMDGSNLAGILLGTQSAVTPRRTLILEYMSLGNVVRYQHLIDTHNHTFRALRVFDPEAPPGLRNLKYIEYRDSQIDWEFERDALEMEVFDLDADPFEMTNLAETLSPIRKERLKTKLERLFRCSGDECRREQIIPLDETTVVHKAIG